MKMDAELSKIIYQMVKAERMMGEQAITFAKDYLLSASEKNTIEDAEKTLQEGADVIRDVILNSPIPECEGNLRAEEMIEHALRLTQETKRSMEILGES
ncbi:MAG: hypothetical protein ACOC3C_04100 [Candidatus Thorarchaeota archaeon]